MSAVDWYLALATALFCIGAYGVLARRNVLLVVMSLEVMLNAVNIALVAFATFIPAARPIDAAKGQLFVLFVIAIAAAEVTVGLAIVIANYRTKRNVQADRFDEMKG
ncbi:MAG TPA: NADH-quinone oxidoreductase subunit NuoK [Thermoleophilia bacterium]|nr:NADH-quinone oxidoreductase subunit NuoK [Thermoleophilia bacterium]